MKHQPIWRVIHGVTLSWVKLSAINCISCCFVFLQSLRERRRASEQTEAQTTEKTKGKQEEDEDENAPFNLCSSVDLDKVTSVCLYVCTCSCMSVCVCEQVMGVRRGESGPQVIHLASFQNSFLIPIISVYLTLKLLHCWTRVVTHHKDRAPPCTHRWYR